MIWTSMLIEINIRIGITLMNGLTTVASLRVWINLKKMRLILQTRMKRQPMVKLKTLTKTLSVISISFQKTTTLRKWMLLLKRRLNFPMIIVPSLSLKDVVKSAARDIARSSKLKSRSSVKMTLSVNSTRHITVKAKNHRQKSGSFMLSTAKMASLESNRTTLRPKLLSIWLPRLKKMTRL